MGQFIRVNGDYNIQAISDLASGGKITLDTGPGVGEVRVTGDLVVEGATVYVSATNLDVEDNIITVNKNESGAGVTLTYAGIEVDRGTLANASLVWNENITHPSANLSGTDGGWELVNGSSGVYDFANSRIKLKEILTDAGTDGGDLLVIGEGTGVIKVIGTDNYENQVTHDDDIPNKKYVDDAIQNNPTFQVVSNDSRVIVSDKDTTGSLAYLTATTGFTTFGESAVSIVVDGILNTQFYTTRTIIRSLEFSGTEITTENSLTNENISLRTQGTGKVSTNYALQLERIAATPAYVSNATLIYSGTPGLGTTGLYYVNDSSETVKRSGELINKNKALVFSMIF